MNLQESISVMAAMDLRQRVRQVRALSGESQARFAQRFRPPVHQATIARWETCSRRFHPTILAELLRQLDEIEAQIKGG